MNDEINIELESDNINLNIEGNEVIRIEDYNILDNKPQINEIELYGNKSLDELGIQEKGNYPNSRVTNLEIDNLF